MVIFEAKSYKQFINSELESSQFKRGSRSRLAEFLGVQTSFTSQVLSGSHDFSVEHGIKVAEFLGLDADETRCLILLISYERAGSVSLKKYYQDELDVLRKSKNDIKNKVKVGLTKKINAEYLQEYYSTWYHVAVHMCAGIEGCSDITTIANVLHLEQRLVRSSVQFLEKAGFLKRVGSRYEPTDQRYHLGDKSPMLRSHHINWRNMAIRSLDENREDSLHYSLVMSLDKKSYSEIRKILLTAIENIEPNLRDAKDEEVCALSFDLYSISDLKQLKA